MYKLQLHIIAEHITSYYYMLLHHMKLHAQTHIATELDTFRVHYISDELYVQLRIHLNTTKEVRMFLFELLYSFLQLI